MLQFSNALLFVSEICSDFCCHADSIGSQQHKYLPLPYKQAETVKYMFFFSYSCITIVKDAVSAKWLVTVVFLVTATGNALRTLLKLFISLIQGVSHREQRTALSPREISFSNSFA